LKRSIQSALAAVHLAREGGARRTFVHVSLRSFRQAARVGKLFAAKIEAVHRPVL
jgi:hypothetical protein